MEAKDSLVKVIDALREIKKPLLRSVFVDYLMGKQTKEIAEAHLDELETYGCGESHDEEYWGMLLDAALKEEYIRIRSAKNGSIEYTAKGRAFTRKPTSFVIEEEEERVEEIITPERGLEELVSNAINEKKAQKTATSSPKTKLQFKLIHAIDRKMALDDFAETEGVGLDEVLDDLELLQQQGHRLNISYFTNEVIGPDDMAELMDYFNEEGDDIDLAMRNQGDVYHEAEIRLARIVWRATKK